MANVQNAERRVPLKWLAWAVAVAAALVVFPPFHVRPLSQGSAVSVAVPGAVEVPRVAEQFWSGFLKPAVDPVDVRTLVAGLGQDPVMAMEKQGHRAGIGGSAFFFVGGEATVRAVDRAGVWLTVDAANAVPTVLVTGPIFGNALRDATGLIEIKDFNAPDFNAVGMELNRLAETRVQPALREGVHVGAQISFLAAGEYDDATSDRPFLKLIPIQVTLKK